MNLYKDYIPLSNGALVLRSKPKNLHLVSSRVTNLCSPINVIFFRINFSNTDGVLCMKTANYLYNVS